MSANISLSWHGLFFCLLCLIVLNGCQSSQANKTRLHEKTPQVVLQQWHTIELDFLGPQLSETGVPNPFLDYRLDVNFTHDSGAQKRVRGFYAADGDAANTSATEGRVWRVRFTPEKIGVWRYSAILRSADNIAIDAIDAFDSEKKAANIVPTSDSQGEFLVVNSEKQAPDFRARGFIETHGPYFRFRHSNEYWLKSGANSPENILAYKDFDGTYRYADNLRQGEANTAVQLHHFAPHGHDWRIGDPEWADGKGRELIGAYNYLASQGMNASYFLTLNIGGDGKDVWPYISHNDFSRFDVSKLAQWNVVFSHMQTQGILLHVVLQETENELLLDDGDIGPQRTLYLNELIARFAHHPALIWNVGEENGPVSWSPRGQNDEQRFAMLALLEHNDPYAHPVVLHTHSTPEDKDRIVEPQLGNTALDGLSFQVEKRPMVNGEIQKWREQSKLAGKELVISMDEIGTWKHGAVPDNLDLNHERLRHWVLWGTFMGGGACVEWYFGSKHDANDLTSEDWRKREQLWTLTNHARSFVEKHLPFWRMNANNALVKQEGDSVFDPQLHPEHGGIEHDDLLEDIKQKPAYAFAEEGLFYVAYLSNSKGAKIDLSNTNGPFQLFWFDPINGGDLQIGSKSDIKAGTWVDIGIPPLNRVNSDWVILIRK